jgi:hypothetical protein
MTCADVKKNWSFEKVMMEHERAVARGRSGPNLPLYQWSALRDLDRLKARFESGDGFSLLQAMRKCANHDLVMPPWVAENYIRRFDRVLNCEAASWDEVFGKPYPGKHISGLRERRALRFAVYFRVREIKDQDPKRTAIDERLFERVGGEFSIGKTRCGELYYEAERRVRQTLPPNSKNSRK